MTPVVSSLFFFLFSINFDLFLNQKCFVDFLHLNFEIDFIFFFFFTDDLITTASLYDVRFEDVFWSVADGDDESLTFSLKSNARLAAGRETFVKTATVVATVYVDGNSVIPFLSIQLS